jgi:hypothetical protein
MRHTHLLFDCFCDCFWGNIPRIFLNVFSKKTFKNHDNFLYITLINIALKICQNMSFKKKVKVIKHVFLLLKSTSYNALLMFFHIFLFILLISKFIHKFPWYYECYDISKSYNFKMTLNYIFNNMEHQTLVTFDVHVVRVTTTTPTCSSCIP